ncbi:DUF6691 family protein [Acidimangrovimonas pyrenivorans]|uniref:DUF6691 family protein n=1 Tax=Acidimangrovimonas pyrenivorans TaxID=2030798 RepID=A0ABV7ADI0_9RHOB
MRLFISTVSGALFGLGLLLSGMTDTAKVQGWLDIAGNWDPTLAFVLGGAVLPMVLAWRLAARRRRAVLGEAIPPMPAQRIDGRLLGGSALFGAGWALAGFCPGPALAALAWSGLGGSVFVIAMIGGMVLFRAAERRVERRAAAAA